MPPVAVTCNNRQGLQTTTRVSSIVDHKAFMICNHCSSVNPDQYKFCGNCGTPLERVPEPVHAASASSYASGISGPSFLGLANESSDVESYLLEDDRPSRSHKGWIAFTVVALAALVGIGVVEWRALQHSAPPPQAATAPAPPSVSATPEPSSQPPVDQSAKTAATDQKAWGAESLPQKDQTAEEKKADQKAMVEATSRQALARNEQEKNKQQEDEDSSADEDTQALQNSKSASVTPAKATQVADQQNRMLQLGEKYLYGHGVSPNCPQAVVYFKAAAQQDSAPAMLHLGAIYASGQCVSQNRTAAYNWFRRAQAVDPNNPWIVKNMDMVLRDMTPQERASLSR